MSDQHHERVTPTQAAQRYRAALMARLDVLADASGSASKPFFEWTVKRLTDIPTSALAEIIGALEHIERAFIFPNDQWDAATRQERE